MNLIANIKYWFQKRSSALDAATVAAEQRSRYNALLGADPQKLTSAVTAFDAGTLAPLARLVEAYELRDDKMKTCSVKMKASAARCDYSIMPREGYENDERAALHVKILKRFWSGISATSRFRRNERGSFSLLVKHMMEAQSFGFSVSEIVWYPLPGGEITADFIHIPLWHFENHTGALRFLPTSTAAEGVPMQEGEWLVATGDGIGIAAAIVACLKRLALADWAVFCERCGMPIIHAKTGAAFGSDQWNNLRRALAAIGRDARIQTDRDTDLSSIAVGGSSAQPYSPLIDWADRAIAALYRGADLSTISNAGNSAVGASLQGDEAGILEQDACNHIAETLHQQVEKFVIRYVTGDTVPLASIVLSPVKRPNIDSEIKIDSHLASLGVKLSKSDALQRYGRSEAASQDDALAQEGVKMNEKGVKINEGLPNEQIPVQTKTTPKSKIPTPLENVIADIIAHTFADELAKASQPKDESDEDDDTTADLPNEISHPCPKCHRQMAADGTCTSCAKRAANHEAGKTAFESVAKSHHDVIGAMERDSIGKIDFIWGDDSEGIRHILKKHKATASHIPGVIAYGDIYENEKDGKYYIIKKRYVVALRKKSSSNHYLITGFMADSSDYAAKIRKENKLVEKGE